MKKCIVGTFLSVLLLIAGLSLFGKTDDIWISFFEDESIYGYKDKKGVIKIKPICWGQCANKFANIIAVIEPHISDGKSKQYYLTKAGKTFGADSTKNDLLAILNPNSDYSILRDRLNSLIFKEAEFEKYFDNCRSDKEWIYPVMNIIVSHNTKNIPQNSYNFL